MIVAILWGCYGHLLGYVHQQHDSWVVISGEFKFHLRGYVREWDAVIVKSMDLAMDLGAPHFLTNEVRSLVDCFFRGLCYPSTELANPPIPFGAWWYFVRYHCWTIDVFVPDVLIMLMLVFYFVYLQPAVAHHHCAVHLGRSWAINRFLLMFWASRSYQISHFLGPVIPCSKLT